MKTATANTLRCDQCGETLPRHLVTAIWCDGCGWRETVCATCGLKGGAIIELASHHDRQHCRDRKVKAA
ncbi:MAG: hypothetical protein WC642_08470 [Nocardioides sp.]|jgi:hypothetical protein